MPEKYLYIMYFYFCFCLLLARAGEIFSLLPKTENGEGVKLPPLHLKVKSGNGKENEIVVLEKKCKIPAVVQQLSLLGRKLPEEESFPLRLESWLWQFACFGVEGWRLSV